MREEKNYSANCVKIYSWDATSNRRKSTGKLEFYAVVGHFTLDLWSGSVCFYLRGENGIN